MLSRLVHSQNKPIAAVERYRNLFEEKNAVYAVHSIKDSEVAEAERRLMEEYGMKEVFVVPVYGENSELVGLISLNNPSVQTRDTSLIPTVAKFISDYTSKVNMKVNFESKIATEPLTGLMNKMSTQNEITDLRKNGTTGVLFIIDIDYFKQLNDTLGHSIGDVALVETAGEIKKTFRNSDVVGRIGGDEFMVFCPNPITDEIATIKAQSICKNCNRTYEKDGLMAEISTSIGILRIDETVSTFQEAYEKVDKALYKAKALGKNQFYFFTNE